MPSISMPRLWRTRDPAPSAPTSHRARSCRVPDEPRTSAATPSLSWVTSTSSVSQQICTSLMPASRRSRTSSIRSCDVSSHGAGDSSTPFTTGCTRVVTRPISVPASVSQYTNCSVHGSGRLTASISSSTPHWRMISAVRTLTDRARGWGFTPSRRSTTIVSSPKRPSRMAIDSPAGPAPATSTVVSVTGAPQLDPQRLGPRRLAHGAPYR